MIPQNTVFCYAGPINQHVPVAQRVAESIEKNSIPFINILKERFSAVIHEFFEGDKDKDFRGIDCAISIFNFSNVRAGLRVRRSSGTIGVTVRKTEPAHMFNPDCPVLILQHNTNTDTIYVADAKICFRLAKAIFQMNKPGVENYKITQNYRYYPQENDSQTYCELSPEYLEAQGALIASVKLHRPVDELANLL